MKETVAYCDLDDKDARRPGVAVLRIDVDGTTHVVDVCQVHLTLLSRLPGTAAARGRRRAVRRAVKRVAVKSAPAKRAAKAAAPAKKVAAKKVAAKKVAAKKVAAKKAPARKAVNATKAPAKRGRPSKASLAGRKPGSRRDQQQRISAAREWARAQGRPIAGKGRLPAGLLEEFERASR